MPVVIGFVMSGSPNGLFFHLENIIIRTWNYFFLHVHTFPMDFVQVSHICLPRSTFTNMEGKELHRKITNSFNLVKLC
jgi:hypothetical protein